MKNLYTLIVFALFLSLFYASKTAQPISYEEREYSNCVKESENFIAEYYLPTIKPTTTTKQTQAKGGIIITTEIVPFNVVRDDVTAKNVACKDMDQPGYDRFEIKTTPNYSVKCGNENNILFKIRIRNNEQVPLVLSQIFFSLAIDGVEYSFPSEAKEDWNKGQIGTGYEKEYIVRGPDIKGLANAQIVRIFLNGVPTSYDKAGNVVKKDNFEWFFDCKIEKIEKPEKIEYKYVSELIEKGQCAKCAGTGLDPHLQTCTICSGKGLLLGQDGKTYGCTKCNRTGKVQHSCNSCYGRGFLEYPKSIAPSIVSSKAWKGGIIEVVTTPSGAKVEVFNIETKVYEYKGISNLKNIRWYGSSENLYPVKIEYNGQTVMAIPYSKEGQLTPTISIDFTTGQPIAKKGKIVQ